MEAEREQESVRVGSGASGESFHLAPPYSRAGWQGRAINAGPAAIEARERRAGVSEPGSTTPRERGQITKARDTRPCARVRPGQPERAGEAQQKAPTSQESK